MHALLALLLLTYYILNTANALKGGKWQAQEFGCCIAMQAAGHAGLIRS
jgi:hypothetical protein